MASSGEKFLYFLVGGFVGATVGLLLAPKSGQETRELIESKYRDSSDRLRRKAQEGREAVTSKYEEGKQAITNRYGEVSSKVTGTIDKTREVLDRQKDQLSAALEAGKKAYEEQKRKLGPDGEAAGEGQQES